MSDDKVRFFATAAAFRRWLEKHHDRADELWVGFYKKGTGRPSITYPEALDVALCFGWIDGIRKGIDETSYTNRFTPRRPRSNWSAVNIKRVGELTAAGLMHPAGLKAFEARDAKRSGIYSFEKTATAFSVAETKAFKAQKGAWSFWQAQPPGYRKTATHFVTSAKKPETRARRFERLVADSAKGLRIKELRR